jgi:hypothetical protein
MLLNFKSPASLVLVVIVTVVTGPVAVFEGPELPVWRLAGDPTADRVVVARPVDVAETVKTAVSVSGPTGIDRVVIKTCGLDWKIPEQYWLPVIESNEPLWSMSLTLSPVVSLTRQVTLLVQ